MRSTQINPQEKDVPAGWPRPHYRIGGGKPKYAQWSSDAASAQIMVCSSSRTYTAGAYNLCSSCGTGMERGLVFDRQWANENYSGGAGRVHQFAAITLTLGRMGEADTHYGSPICYRCAVFALKHCPFFSVLHEVYGDELVWLVITRAEQYREFDDSSAITILDAAALERTTTGQVKAEVRAGYLHLMAVGADDLPALQRPADFTDGEPNGAGQPKFAPEQVRTRQVQEPRMVVPALSAETEEATADRVEE